MPKVESSILIADLKRRTEFCIKEAKKLARLKEERLNDRPNPETWSSLQCLDHLNQYGEFYLPEMWNGINESTTPPNHYFGPGFIGNMFAKSMLANPGFTKMQAPLNLTPSLEAMTKDVVNTFIEQQKEYLQILKTVENKNLNKIKIKVTISKWIKLKLGDVLRVTVFHNERHIIQATKAANLK